MWSRAAASAILLVSLGWIGWMLLRERSLSGPAGIEDALATGFPRLLGNGSTAACSNSANPLRCASELVLKEGRIQRDLVITASMLSSRHADEKSRRLMHTTAVPEDLYFYYSRVDDVRHRPNGASFIPLRGENEKHLLDVVVGSSTIFPVFPPKQIQGVKMPAQALQDIVLIDGGFAHNNPIDAAVSWGATHIIAIQASAEESSKHETFFQNCLGALNYLMNQAQRVDHISAGKVVIFELRPPCLNCDDASAFEAKHSAADRGLRNRHNLDLFDFDRALVESNIRYGEEDAGSLRPRFRRAVGEPKFRELGTR
jgi:hypothetical protein